MDFILFKKKVLMFAGASMGRRELIIKWRVAVSMTESVNSGVNRDGTPLLHVLFTLFYHEFFSFN